VVRVETLPLDHVPEDLKPMRDVEVHSVVPRKTITCGNNPDGPHYYTPKTIPHRKVDSSASSDEDRVRMMEVTKRHLATHNIKTEPLPKIEIVPYVSYGAVTYKN
jgi:hypothetical protein